MRIILLALALLSSTQLFAADFAKVERMDSGNRISENLPAIPGDLLERLNQYQNTRGASFQGWIDNGSMLIVTRFGDTAQIHRVNRTNRQSRPWQWRRCLVPDVQGRRPRFCQESQ